MSPVGQAAIFAVGGGLGAGLPIVLGKPGKMGVNRAVLVTALIAAAAIMLVGLLNALWVAPESWRVAMVVGGLSLAAVIAFLVRRRIAAHWLFSRKKGWRLDHVLKAVGYLLRYYRRQEVIVERNNAQPEPIDLQLIVGRTVRVPLWLYIRGNDPDLYVLREVWAYFTKLNPDDLPSDLRWVSLLKAGRKAEIVGTVGRNHQ